MEPQQDRLEQAAKQGSFFNRHRWWLCSTDDATSVLRELRIRTQEHQYKPTVAERRELATDIALLYNGPGIIAAMVAGPAWFVSSVLFRRRGLRTPITVGGLTYLFCKATLPGAMLANLAEMDSPVGGEVAALVREYKLDMRLLALREKRALGEDAPRIVRDQDAAAWETYNPSSEGAAEEATASSQPASDAGGGTAGLDMPPVDLGWSGLEGDDLGRSAGEGGSHRRTDRRQGAPARPRRAQQGNEAELDDYFDHRWDNK